MMGGSQSVTPEVEAEAPGGVGPLEENSVGPVPGEQQEAIASPTVAPSLVEVTSEEAIGERAAPAAASSGEVLFRPPDREVASPTDSEAWGHWRPIAIGDTDVPRITPVDPKQPPPLPGQRLTALHHALLLDMRRRIVEAAELGVHLIPSPWPGPLARPMWQSSWGLRDLWRISNFGSSQRVCSPDSMAPGFPRFPEGPQPPEVLPEPVHEEARRPKRFREVGTSTMDQEAAAEERLRLLLQGLRPVDVLGAIDRPGVAAKGAGRNDRRERECSISAMEYLQRLLIALRAFIGAKAGERPLLAMRESRLFEGPRFTRYRDERVAWGELTTSLRLRADAALQSKEASNARRAARDSRRRLKPKARAGPGGSTSDESSSTSISADEDLHGEGPEEAMRLRIAALTLDCRLWHCDTTNWTTVKQTPNKKKTLNH